ncbi:MAG: NUDIX domain-containing protein [Xanthobacteraceae bacterium]
MARRSQISAGLLAFRLRPKRAPVPSTTPGAADGGNVGAVKPAASWPQNAAALEVLLAHPGGPFWKKRDAGAWTIPKGLLEPGADVLATAEREFTEETGFTATGNFVPLRPVKQKSGKVVHAFAVEADFAAQAFTSNPFEMEWPPKSGQLQTFPEIDQLAWFAMPEALTKIIAYQQPFLIELQQILCRRLAAPPHRN